MMWDMIWWGFIAWLIWVIGKSWIAILSGRERQEKLEELQKNLALMTEAVTQLKQENNRLRARIQNVAPSISTGWRAVFAIEQNRVPSIDEVRAIYRAKLMHAHPDRPGGSTERAKLLNVAFDQAKRELR